MMIALPAISIRKWQKAAGKPVRIPATGSHISYHVLSPVITYPDTVRCGILWCDTVFRYIAIRVLLALSRQVTAIYQSTTYL